MSSIEIPNYRFHSTFLLFDIRNFYPKLRNRPPMNLNFQVHHLQQALNILRSWYKEKIRIYMEFYYFICSLKFYSIYTSVSTILGIREIKMN